MALSTATITYDLANLSGVTFNARRTKVWANTNVEGDAIIDTDADEIRLGCGDGTIADDGTGSIDVWVPGVDSNPASWQTWIHVDYPDRHGRASRTFGPFTIAGDADLADLVEEQEIPPDYAGTLVAQVEGLVDEAETAEAAAAAHRAAVEAIIISDLGTSDGQVKTLVETDGTLTNAALLSTIVNREQTAELAYKRILKIDPTTPSVAPFEVDFNSYANTGGGAGTYNHGTFFGYNVGRHSGGATTAGQDSLIMGFERNYFDAPGSGEFGPEWYVEHWTSDGEWSMFRPFYTRIERPGAPDEIAAATHFDIGNHADGGFTVLSDFQHQAPADAKLFEITNVSTTVYQQLNVTGNLVVNKASAAQFSLISAAGQSLLTIDSPSASTLHFRVSGAAAWYFNASDVNNLSLLDKTAADFLKFTYSTFGVLGKRAELEASAYVRGQLVVGTTALPTNSTDGFVYIPTMAGTPSGSPTAQNASKPIVYDTTANKLWIHNGTWKSVTLA